MNGPFADRPERELTEATRRNIADELKLQKMAPNGRLNEVEFFGRLFNLTELPTRDHRTHQFPNMAADLWQHRVNNLSSLGRSLAELRNAFGTGHGQAAGHIGLDAHHARLAVRMATAVGVFLYEVHERNPAAG